MSLEKPGRLVQTQNSELTTHNSELPSTGYNFNVEDLIRRLLAELGEDPSREGLVRTPQRVERALKFLTSGYNANVDAILNGALFTVDYNEMVIVKDIDFYSLCEHHMLPFFGKCHVAYIPRRHVIGLSKIPRLVDVFARRLQIQERMTNQIAQTILEKINPLGVAVVCEGTHLCMSMRGVEKQNSFAVTSAMLGAFRDNSRTRMEFLELIKHKSETPVAMPSVPAGLTCVSD
jgi:GTP cyclohydrolase I